MRRELERVKWAVGVIEERYLPGLTVPPVGHIASIGSLDDSRSTLPPATFLDSVQ